MEQMVRGLREQGWKITVDDALRDPSSGLPLRLEFMLWRHSVNGWILQTPSPNSD